VKLAREERVRGISGRSLRRPEICWGGVWSNDSPHPDVLALGSTRYVGWDRIEREPRVTEMSD
jgi:hypothetical protein